MRTRILLVLFILATFGVRDVKAQCSVNSTPGSYCGSGDAIGSFTLAGVPTVGNAGCTNGSGYSFFSTPIRQLAPGGTYSFTATIANSSFPQGFAIWIDLNGDGTYASNEQLYVSTSYLTTHTGTITIPTTATGSQVRMRTMCCYYYHPGAGEACTAPGYAYYGETEDYWVELCKPPVITSQPTDTFACEGSTTQFSISATGAGAYQWQSNSGAGWANVNNGTNFSGATTNTLTILNAPATLNLANFRCIAMASCSNNVRDTSELGILTILPNTKIVFHTLRDTSCTTLQTRLFVKNDGVITNRRWQIWSDNDQDYIDVPPQPFTNLGDTLLIQNIPDTLNGAKIRCIVEGVCGSDTTAVIPLVVNAVPEIVGSPSDQTLDPGQTATFQVLAAGVSVRYQWQAGVNDSFANINDGGIYKGVKTDRLTVTGVSRVQDGYQFRCIIKGSGSCAAEPDTSNFGVLYVNPAVSVAGLSNINNIITVFPNPTAGNHILVKIDNALEGSIKYQLLDRTGRIVGNGNLNAQGITNIDITSLTPGIYTVQVTDKDGGVVSVPSRFTRL